MIITPAIQSALNSGAWEHQWLLHFRARNRTNNQFEEMSLWTGMDNATFLVDGNNRTYLGAGQVIEMPSFQFSTGLEVQELDLNLEILSPEVTNLIRAYDSKLAPIKIHLAVFNAQGQLAGITEVFDGFIDGPISIDETEDNASSTMKIVTNVREGTKTMSNMKSHESQKLRDPTDQGFMYATIAGSTKVSWGMGEGDRMRDKMRR